jgi:hypothetical protein
MKMSYLYSLRNNGIVALMIGMSLVLAACSKEPSASDIDKVIRAESAGSKGIVIHEVRKMSRLTRQ